MNVSDGFTKYAHILHYAGHTRGNIKRGIDDGKLYLSGCGSGRLVAFHWEMHPEKYFAVGICAETRVIANRVKGYIRELLDSVYIVSEYDSNHLLRPCDGINEKIRNALHNIFMCPQYKFISCKLERCWTAVVFV